LTDKTQGYYPSQKKLYNDPNSDDRTYEYSNALKQGYVSSSGNVAIVEKEYMNKATYGTFCSCHGDEESLDAGDG
jgi:hypothetical protein